MPILSVRTELWFAWSEVAAEQELASRSWRARGEGDVASGRNPSESIAQENKAALAALAACGAALETFGRYLAYYGEVPPRDDEPAARRLIRQIGHIYPEADLTSTLRGQVREVFRWRNQTMHYASRPEQMGAHPLGMTTTWVARTFTSERAAQMVDAVADVYTATFTPGTSPNERAEWEAMRCRSVGSALRARSKVPVDVVP